MRGFRHTENIHNAFTSFYLPVVNKRPDVAKLMASVSLNDHWGMPL